MRPPAAQASSRPIVGITIGYDPKAPEAFFLRHDYVRAVEAAGGVPLVLAPGLPRDVAPLLARVQAVVLSGGSDLDPRLYGQKRHESVTRVIWERDIFELALTREALERDLPILAICRGHQLLNVATGGTLIQDIASLVAGADEHDADTPRAETVHQVAVLPGSRLRAILGRDTVAVNSFHHQAIKELGHGMVVSARAKDDDVVEGIEAPGRRFVLGVQWHPEAFWSKPDGFQPLFESLVEAGRGAQP